MHTVPLSSASAASRYAPDCADSTVRLIIEVLEDQKAEHIVSIDLRGKSLVADILVIASGRSRRHVASIAERICRDLKNVGVRTGRPEGAPECNWVLIDACEVVVHIFTPEARAFYDLERLWLGKATGDTPG